MDFDKDMEWEQNWFIFSLQSFDFYMRNELAWGRIDDYVINSVKMRDNILRNHRIALGLN